MKRGYGYKNGQLFGYNVIIAPLYEDKMVVVVLKFIHIAIVFAEQSAGVGDGAIFAGNAIDAEPGTREVGGADHHTFNAVIIFAYIGDHLAGQAERGAFGNVHIHTGSQRNAKEAVQAGQVHGNSFRIRSKKLGLVVVRLIERRHVLIVLRKRSKACTGYANA